MVLLDYRVGDILQVSCPSTEVRITGKSRNEVTVEWPWWTTDPDCDWSEWNGQVALPANPDSQDWEHELFRIEPTAEPLRIGDICRIGIPPTAVHVVNVGHFDPPLETGRLPRPRTEVVVVRAGISYDAEVAWEGCGIAPDDDIPITFNLLFRPYACLVAGDEVADASRRVWRFDGPWDWSPFDGGELREPTWPLTLLSRNNGAIPITAAALAQATRTGSHRQEMTRWIDLARAIPARMALRRQD
ncbi:hypothetical protein [Nocardiopsis tropica]|uniref:Uncharacterized protein n=1 Tax=Nocardiopsis tropica TaxID=109330 RepID=A0ABU7KS63_9ACTN|nr:hypothetical protein [Nocardiopsis umidischolae]MEE2052156.1 hypothetical protein [Nocardiopsis umidischolae]